MGNADYTKDVDGIGMSRQMADAIDARMVELGMASADEFRPGSERFYGSIKPGEFYDAARVRELGEMPDMSFSTPAEAIAAQQRERDEYAAALAEIPEDEPECD